MDRLRKIIPRENPPIPLPEPPARYLQRLDRRLQAIAAGKIGSAAPILRRKASAKE
jgi:hypothetical protein